MLAIILASLISFTPPPNAEQLKPVPKVKPAFPNISGKSFWGMVEQKGKTITISGHADWSASGEFRPDGKIFLTWLHSDGRVGISVYEINLDHVGIHGQWGWVGDVEYDGADVRGGSADILREGK